MAHGWLLFGGRGRGAATSGAPLDVEQQAAGAV